MIGDLGKFYGISKIASAIVISAGGGGVEVKFLIVLGLIANCLLVGEF